MRILTTLFVMLFAFSSYAESLPKRLTFLNKILTITSADHKMKFELRFKKAEDDKIQFVGNIFTPEEKYGEELSAVVFLEGRKVSMIANYSLGHNQEYRVYFDLGSSPKKGSLVNITKLQKMNGTYSDVENNLPELSIANNIFALEDYKRLFSKITFSGPINFSPCDGCEHSDMLMITQTKDRKELKTVNAISVMPSDYYAGDCPGTIHKWIEDMEKNAIEMTFSGKVSADVQDYWDLDDFWEAQGGELYFDRAEINIVNDFLNSLPARFSELNGKKVTKFELETEMKISKVNRGVQFDYFGHLVTLNKYNGKVTTQKRK